MEVRAMTVQTSAMPRAIHVAVVGAGPAGQAHAFGFRNAAMSDDLAGVEVVLDTIVDPNTALAETVARRYGFANVAADVSEILDKDEIEVVSIALPSFLSVPVLGSLLRAGKHVLGEKPLGRSGAEAAELVEIARETDRIAAVGFSYRRIPAVAQLRDAVRDGAIGRPYFARAHFFSDYALDPTSPMVWRFDQDASGGGTILDMATHAIDALEYVLGDVDEVLACTLDTTITERPGKDGAMHAVTNDDTALIDLRFADGALASVLSSRVGAGCPIELGFEVFGSEGHVRYCFNRPNEWVLYQKGLGEEGMDAPRTIIPGPAARHFVDTMPMAARGNATGYGEAFVAQMQELLRAVVSGEPMDTSFEAAARTMRVVDAAFASASEHRPVAVA